MRGGCALCLTFWKACHEEQKSQFSGASGKSNQWIETSEVEYGLQSHAELYKCHWFTYKSSLFSVPFHASGKKISKSRQGTKWVHTLHLSAVSSPFSDPTGSCQGGSEPSLCGDKQTASAPVSRPPGWERAHLVVQLRVSLSENSHLEKTKNKNKKNSGLGKATWEGAHGGQWSAVLSRRAGSAALAADRFPGQP